MASGNCWRICRSKKRNGKVYYYNPSTKESVWEKPKDFNEDKMRPSSSAVHRSENVISNNGQNEVDNCKVNTIRSYSVDHCNELSTRNNSGYEDSVICGISKRNTKLLNEENLKGVSKDSQSVRNLADNSKQFGCPHSSKIVNIPKLKETVGCKTLQYQEHIVNNKRKHNEEITSKLEGLPKKVNTIDKEEHNKDNDHPQHSPDQSKLNRQQRNLRKRAKRTKKKKPPLNELQIKSETRNSTKVQAAEEKSDLLNYSEDEKMEWEPIDEDQIHKSKEIQTENVVSEMEWITTACADRIDFGSQFYIVLDTNVLVLSIKFIKELQNMSGNGCPLLLIPYQVLVELDRLKQRKSGASVGARQAIDVIYQTLKKKGSTRIRGQSASEAQDFSLNLDKNIADDAIINCCLQQIKKGNDVALLTLDKNLFSKALMNGVKVYTVEDMSKAVSDAKKMSVSLKQAIFGDGTSVVTRTNHMVTPDMGFSAETSTAAVAESSSVLITVTDKLKECLLSFVNDVVQRGMYLMYGEKWEPRCAIKPPWNLERGLRCLLHHWYAIMESFARGDIKRTIKFLQKAFSENDSSTWTQKTVMEMLEASSDLSSALSPKYTTLASSLMYTINELRRLINEQPAIDVKSIEPAGTDEQAFGAESAFGDMWTLLWDFCTSLYIALGWEELKNPVASVPSFVEMKAHIPVYYTATLNLLQAASGILEADCEELTVTHPSVVLMYTTVCEFLKRARAPLLCDISVQNILAFVTRKEYRDKLRDAISALGELSSKFLKCIVKMEKT